MSNTQPPAFDPSLQHSPERSTAGAPLPPVTRKNWFARHKVLTILGALVVVIVIIAVAASAGSPKGGSTPAGGESTVSQPGDDGQSAETAAEPAGPGLNTPVSEGDFEFTILGVEPIGQQIGTEYLNKTAQGQFVKLTVRVTNTSKESQTFLANYLKLTDADGRTYDSDTLASMYASPDMQSWIVAINPGNSIEGPVVFDIPVDAVPTAVTVKGGLFGGETSIALR